MSRKKKNAAQQRQTSRELIDIQKITEYGLLTSHGELVFFSIEPTNLSVHSPESIGSRIYALMTVLKGMAEIEMLALNSKESFEDNKRHYFWSKVKYRRISVRLCGGCAGAQN